MDYRLHRGRNFKICGELTMTETKDKIRVMKAPLCGKLIKTIDNTKLPCLRPSGHTDGCNPFSDSPTPAG